MKIENFKLEERVLFEAGAVVQAAEAAAADQANNDAAGDGSAAAEMQSDDNQTASNELTPESLAEMPVPPEMAGSDNADDSAGADADGNAAADPESDAGSNAISFLDAPISEAASETSERILVVLNSSVADADSIIAGLGENVEVLKLTAGTDALDSINDYLDAHADTEYSAIHIVSHGNEGYISLNGERIDAATLNPADWKAIGEHLSDDADILIYGCDTAKSDEGKALVQSIADLTGADVAASTDSTGANGDWDLEYRSGLIEAATLAPESYRYDLEAKAITITVNTIEGGINSTDGLTTFEEAIQLVNADEEGNEYTIVFGDLDYSLDGKNNPDTYNPYVWITSDINIEKDVTIVGASTYYDQVMIAIDPKGEVSKDLTITIADNVNVTVQGNVIFSRNPGMGIDSEVNGTGTKKKVNIAGNGNVTVAADATLSAFDNFNIGKLDNKGEVILYGTDNSFSVAEEGGNFGNVTYIRLLHTEKPYFSKWAYDPGAPDIVEGSYATLSVYTADIVLGAYGADEFTDKRGSDPEANDYRLNPWIRKVFLYGQTAYKTVEDGKYGDLKINYYTSATGTVNFTGDISANNLVIGDGTTLNITGTIDADATTIGTNQSYTGISTPVRGALSVSGDFDGGAITNYGTLTLSGTNNDGSGTQLGNVTYNSADGQTIISGTYGDLTIATTGTATAAGDITATATTIGASSVLDANGDLAAGTLTNNGSIAVGGAFSATAENFGNVTYDGEEAQNIFGGTYNNLILSGGDKTLSDAVTVTGDLTAGVRINAAYDLTLSGAVSGTGTVAATAGTVTYNGTDQTVLAGTYHDLSLSSGTKTLAGAVTANGKFSATNTTITRGEAAENVSLTLSDAGNNTTPSTLISAANFNGISVTNTIENGDGYLHLNEVNNTADANSTGIKFVFDAQITVGEITYGQTLGDIVITAKNNLGETILSGKVAELGWKWQLNDETVANSTVLNVTAGTAYNLVTNTNSTVGSQNVVVNKATLTITAQNLTKVYGDADTAITDPRYTVSGLVNGDTETGIGLNVTWTREAGENVIRTGTDAEGNPVYGGYAITVSGELTSGNYELVYAEQDAFLTITPKQLQSTGFGTTLTINLASREYDGTTKIYKEAVTITIQGITADGTLNVAYDTENSNYDHADVLTCKNALFTGLYVVDAEGNINYNYTLSKTEYSYSAANMIVAKNVEVVADGVGTSITYGESPDLTYTVYEYTPGEGGEAGVRGNEWTLNDLTGELDTSEYTNPGTDQSTTATITQGTLTNENNPNYNITFTGGDFTVNGRAAETKSLTVTTAEDVENDSDDKISLREAILYAAQDAAAVANGDLTESALAVNGVYTITFGNEVTTITVTSALKIGANAFAGEGVELVINGAGQVTLSGNGTSQILNIAAGNDVTVNGITFTQGYSADAHGGAVYNDGKLTITDSTFTGNSTKKSAGAIKNEGVMVIIDSTFTSNTTTSYGGAIYNTSDLTITDSTFTSNTASNYGGAIYNADDLTITGSTFTNNVAKQGGAILNSGTVQVTDAVFTDNTLSSSSGKGGNLYNSAGSAVLERTLFKANNTARLNGVGTLFYVAGGTVDMIESTVYGSTATGSGGYSYGFHGANTNGHVVTITSGATLNMINSTAYTAVYAGGTSDTYKKFAYDVISGGTFNVINSIITTHRSGAHYGSYAINGSYNNYSSLVGSNAFESFSSTTNTFALKADSEASGGGTLVGKLDGSYYYLTKDADGDRIWQQVGGDRHYDFDAADTTNYGLKYTGTDPETGSESVITGLVYTTALNGVSRVLTLDTFNMGSHALTPVGPAAVGSLTVTTAYDTSFANSLRVVLAYAETLDGEQTITFADGITIVYLHNDLNINKSVTIDGGTTPRIVSGDYPEESAKLSETMATGVCINVATGGNDSTITLKDGVTLTVANYLTISRWHGMEGDGEVETSNDIKPQVNLTGGNVTINQNAKLTVYDNFETGTLINNGSLFLSGKKNDFHAADGGDFGNVTYVALQHSKKEYNDWGTIKYFDAINIADPNIVAGTYKTLSVYSADLIRYQGWSRVPWFYGSTVTSSRDGGNLIAQTTAELTANGNVTAEHLIIGDGVTLKIAANGDATQKGDLTVTGTTTVGSSEDYDGITDPVRGTLIVEGNITVETLTNIGGITVGGDFTATAENYGKVTYKGNADQKVSAGTYTDLVIETAGTATAAGSVTAETTTVDETATFDVDGDLSAGTLTNNGTIALSGSLSGTVDTTWGKMIYDGDSAQDVFAGTYGNLTLSGEGVKTLAGAIVVNGDFTANAAFGTANDLTLHGAVSGTGTINATAGTVTYDLDSTEKVQVILAGTYYNLALSGGTRILTSATVSNTFSASNTKLQKADDAVSNATLTLKSSATAGTSSTPSSTISGVTFNGISVTDGEGDAAPLYVDALTNIVPEGNENIVTVIGATITLGNPDDTDYSIDYGTALGDVVVTITYLNGEKQTGTVSELGWNWEIGDDTDNNDNDAIVDATEGTVYHLIAPSGNTVEVTLKVNRLQKTITVNTYLDKVDDGSDQADFDFIGEDYSSMIKGTDGRTSFREAINRVNALGKNVDFTITFGKMEAGGYENDVRNYVTLSGDIAFQYSFTIQAVDYTNANTDGYVANGNLVLDYGSMFKGVSATDYATKGVWIIIGSGADAQDAKISMTEGVTLTVNGNLTISRFAGYDNDSEIKKKDTDENGNPVMEWTKPELDLSGGNISISEGSILTVFDDFNIGTLDNAGKLYLYGNSNTFSAAADKTFGDVTYVALGLRQATAENNTDYVFSTPNVQEGTYSTLSFESAELFKSGWSRRVWLYGTSAFSTPAQTTFTSAFNGSFVAAGNVTAATTNLSTGATLNVNGNFNGGTLTNNGTLILSGAENAATGTLGNVIYDGTETQNVIGGDYGKLTLENGTKVMSSTTATKVIQNFTATDTTIRSDSSSLASLTVTDAGTATSATTAVSGVTFENMAVVNTANTEKLLHVSILNNATDEATTGVNLVSTSVDDLTFTYGTELGDAIITIRNGAGDVISGNQTLEELGWELQKADAEAEGGFVTLAYGTILNVAESGTYRIKTASGYTEEVKITVNKATLTIKANDASKTYGDLKDPEFTYQAPVGLVGTDTVTVSLNRATGENAGTYAITITATIENGDSNNYEIDPENGTFTINRKAITVTPDADQSVSNAGSFTYTVTDADGNPLTVTLSGALSFDKVTHMITQGTLTNANNKNYSITFTSGVAVGTEAKSLTVTTAEDIVDAYDGKISLREAIAYAEAGDTITFASDITTVNLSRDLAISTSLTIEGGTGVAITVAAGVDGDPDDADSIDAEIQIAQDVTLTVSGKLDISRYAANNNDTEVGLDRTNNISKNAQAKPQVNLTGAGNLAIAADANLSVFDGIQINQLDNKGNLFLYGKNSNGTANTFTAATEGGSLGNVTYTALYHREGTTPFYDITVYFDEVVIPAPDIVAGNYDNLTINSAELVRNNGFVRYIYNYGSLVAGSKDHNSKDYYVYNTAEFSVTGDISANTLNIGNGVTLNVTGAVDAENTTVGTNDTLSKIAEANRHWGALNVSGNFDGGAISNNGTLTLSGAENAGAGTLGDVTYKGADGQTIISGTYGDLTIETAGTAMAEGAVTADTTTVKANATLDANGDLTAGALTNSGIVKVAGAFSATAENLGNVTYDGTEQTILAGTYGNLTLENGTKTLSSATVNDTFTATSTTLQKAVDAESNATLTLTDAGTSTEPSGTVSNTAFNGISVTNTAGDGNLYVNAKGGNSVDDASERIVLVGLTSITVGGYGTDGTLNATYGETLTLTETKKEITVNIDGENVTLYLDVTWKTSDELSDDMSMSGFVNAGTYNGVLTVDTVKAYTKDGEVYTEVTNRYAWDKSVSSDLVIGKATITVSGITANGKTYDGKEAAEIVTSGADLEGKVEGDDLTITATGAFADADAGANKEVTGTFELTGADAANYTLADNTFSTTATIAAQKVDLVWSSTGVTYTYNGDVQSVTATYTDVTGATQNAVISFGDGVTFKNVGDYIATAAAVANYSFTNATQNLNIGMATISVSDIMAAITEQTYDGKTAVQSATLTVAGLGTDGTLTVNFTSAVFNSANVKDVATATFSGLSLANSNYQLSADTITVGAAGKITAKEVTLGWEKADSYTYTGEDQSDTVKAYYTDVDGEKQYVTVTFDQTFQNAGDYTASAAASAADSNYNWSASSLDLTIAKAKITVSGISANGKVYDGTTDAEIVTTGVDLAGKVKGDDLTITATGAFADADAGENKSVTGTFELTGAAKDNYELTANTFSTTATITAKEVTLAWEKADSYTYTGADQSGTVKATYTDVNGATQDADVSFGDGITFKNEGDYTATAAAVANYSFTNATQSLKINKLALTVTGASETVTYDGNAHTLNSVTPGTTSVNGHTVSTTATVTGTNAGEYDLNIANAVVVKDAEGNDVTANYEITTTNGKLTINKALLTVTLQDATVTYGNADPELTYSVSGIVDGSDGADLADVTLSREAGTDVGQYLISATATSKSGNYDVKVADTAAYLTITAKEISIDSVTLADKTYDGNTSATITGATVSGVVGSDEVTVDFSSANAAFTNANAGAAVSFQASGFTLTGADAGNYKLTETPFDGTAEINKAKIIISNIAAADREYNGETGAVVTFDKNGIIAGDETKVALAVTGTFADGDAAADKTVSLVWTLTGEAAGNYELSGNLTETTADITAKKITVTAADVTATYGQDYTLTHNGVLLGSDTFTGALEVKDVAYSTANKLKAGSYTIGQGNLSAGSNYEITFVDGTLTIDKAALSVATMTATDRAYNGTMAVELNGYTFNGLVGADAVTLTATGTAASKNAGTQNVTFSNLAIDGADKDNYTFNAAAPAGTVSVVISKAAISITANNASKVYNTADPALGYTVTAGELFAGDSIALSREAGDDVGTYEINGCTITDGNNGENYAVTFTPGIFTIANKAATITVGTTTLTYNGAAQAATEYTVEGLEDGHKVSSITLTGATNAGSYEATVVSVTILDADDNDVTSQYGLTYVAGTLNINKVTIMVSDIVAANREYNGETGADVTFKESGILAVDTDKVTLSVTGAFDNKNVGTGKQVSLTWDLTGAAAGNYELSGNEATATATITAKEISISGITAADKTYDGNDTTTVDKSAASLTGNVADDDLDFTVTGAFADADAGENKTVNLTVTLTGTDKDNYVFADASQKTATATINKAQITISGITAANKTYDGNTTATLDYSKVVFGGIVGSDKLTVTATGAFESAAAGTGKNVAISGLTLGGESLANYELAATGNQSETTATINKAQITISGITAENKTYDGNTAAALDYSNVVFDGIVGSDKLTVTATGAFESASAGTGKNVAISGLTLGGDSLANYELAATGNQTETTATINKAQITISGITANSKTYDGNTTATLDYSNVVFGGIVGSDKLTVTATGAFESAAAGTGKNVAISGLTLGGESLANYELAATGNQSSTTATINKAALTVTAQDATITYGEDHSSILSSSYTVTGMVNGEAASVVTGAMDIENATNLSGANKLKADANDLYKFTIGTLTAANYDITFVAQDGTDVKALTVNKLDLSATVNFATSKVYNGTTAVTVNSSSLDTVLTNDTVNFNAVLVYNDANVANANKIVSQTWEITGADAANYNLAAFTETTGTITAKEIDLTWSSAGVTYTYNGDVQSVTATYTDVNGATQNADVSFGDGITFKNEGDYTATAAAVANYSFTNATQKLKINKLALTVTGASETVTYDGTAHTLNRVTPGNTIVQGHTVSTTATVTGTDAGVYDLNIENAVAVKDAEGNDVTANYEITTNNGKLTINKKMLSVDAIEANITEQTYDGDTTLDSATLTIDGVSVSWTNAAFNSADVADVTEATFSGLTVDSNYALSADTVTVDAMGKILAKKISLGGLTVADKVYDGTKVAEITGIGFAEGAIISDDTVTVDTTGATANFDSANAADSIKVTASGFTLSGTDADNYELISDSIETTARINKATISVNDINAAITEQTYDGKTAVQSATLTVAGIGTDGTLTVNYTSGAFNSANVKDVTTATFSGLSLANSNYQLSADTVTVDATGMITAKDVTLAWEKADSYTYTGADQSGTVKAYYTDVTGAKQYVTVTFDNTFRNAGDYTASAEASAADGNYKYAASELDLTIAKAKITISNIAAVNREYNGGTGANVTFDKSGIVAADNAKVTLTVTGAFDNKNVGTDKAVSLTWSLTGEAAGNYELSGNAAATTADITAKEITVSGITAGNKVYDGTTDATVNTSAATFTGMITGDNLTVSTSGTFGDKNVGTGKTVTFGALTLGGTDAGNYVLAASGNQSSATADITAKEITVSGITASNKVYDSTTSATVDTSAATFAGMITGDKLTVSTSGTFGDKNVGTGKTVTFGSLTLGGTDAGNYVLAATGNQSSATADITAKEITVSGITASNKVYDGNDTATVDTSAATFTGMITGDNLTVSTSGTFGDKNVATGKTVTFGALTLGGADAGNYVLAATGNQSSTTATITAKEISINGVTIADKIYDGNTTATITGATVSGVIGSDVVSVDISGASATFANANVGTGILVNANGLALTGADSANYKLTSNAFETTGNITKATVTVTADAQSKVYGEADPPLTYQVSGLVGSDALTGELSRDAGENVGTYAITKGTLAASSNYNLVFTGADLTITKATVTVTANAQSKVYGEADPTLTYKVTGLVGSDALTGELSRDAGENVGTYAISQGTLAASANYDLVFTGADLTITKATVTVTADAQSKVYGETDPSLTYQVSGLVGSDALTGELSRDAGENVGTYAITKGTLAASANYNLEFTGADLTITKATVTVTADAQSKVYGETDPSLTYQVSGLVGSDALMGELSRDAGENVGTYAITKGTLAASSNYDLVFNGADLTITKATVTVTADAQRKVYGEADPTLTYQVSGLVGSDALTGALSRDAGENVGTYAITQGTLSAGDNYDMNFTGALFTINAKPEEPGTGSDPSTEISVNPSFNADNDASSPDYRVYGKPQREAARTAWLQDAMAPFTGGKFSVTAVEDGRRHGVELGFDATPISTSVQTHHEMYGIHDDEILDDHKVFDRYEHHVIEAQEPVSLDGDTEMDLTAAQDVMDALEDLLLEIPAVELTAKASLFHDDFDTALNDLLTI